MNKRSIKFGDTEIGEYEFHQYKNSISISNIDINKIVLSNKLPFGIKEFYLIILIKYLIGYKDAKK